jgi:glycosyltransferase involved in cell wall biosynthesis
VKVAILAAGAGGMYCGSCLRDNSLAAGLRQIGHDARLVCLYTPLRSESADASEGEIFYGGINIYLQHASAIFRKAPRWMDWLFDRRWLLRVAGDLGAQTPPAKLADLTADILRGEEGPVRKELHRLVEYLRDEVKPQVVNLPNLMFVGMAQTFARELKVPVVCELTGEDIFLDAMGAEDRQRIGEMIRQRAGHVARFVSTSGYYADRMAEYLGIDRGRIDVVATGLSEEYFVPVKGAKGSARSKVVGYMARICPEKGLDRLVEAMELVRGRAGMGDVKLLAAGYLGARNRKWFEALRHRIARGPMRDGFTFLGEVDRADKIAMLDSVDVFSVPAAYPEAKGIYVLEAMSRGIPVVQPRHGSFVEMIEQTGGGILVEPGNAEKLAGEIANLLENGAEREKLGAAGRAAVEGNFTQRQMAERMAKVYQALL